MKLLMLYGVNCTPSVWDKLKPYLEGFDVDYAEYPHEVTMQAEKAEDLTAWVYNTYKDQAYDAIIGHSLGGMIALQLAALYKMNVGKIIYLDTNLKPANAFYRNLMTAEHMEQFGDELLSVFQKERQYYTPALFEALQKEFDYTEYVRTVRQPVYGIYGDRGEPDYIDKVKDLNLPEEVLDKLNLMFVPNACHMIMMENPEQLHEMLIEILESEE